MKFRFADEKLMYAEPMFRRIAGQYLAMLKADFFFRAQLEAVEVIVDGSAGPDNFQGLCIVDTAGQACSIILHLTPEMTDGEKAHVIAHEIGHMLISNMGFGALTMRADGEIGITNGVICNEGFGEMVGMGLEEGIADCMAEEVVGRIWPEWAKEYRRREQDAARDFLVRAVCELSGCFGKRLEKLEQFDQEIEIGKKIYFRQIPVHEAEVISAFTYFGNMFWVCLCRHSFDLIRRMFEEIMGEGSFAKLCLKLDAVYKQEQWTLEEKALIRMFGEEPEEYGEILEEIRQFRQQKRQKEREYREISDRRIAADSLKAAFDMMKQHCREIYALEGYEEFRAEAKKFEKTLNKGRVWKSISEARAAFDRLNLMDKPVLGYLPVGIIGQIMDAACEVAAHYEKQEAGTAEPAVVLENA